MLYVDKEGWDGGGGRKTQEGEGICILMPDSPCCTEKSNTTLQSNYPPIKKNFKGEKKEKKILPLQQLEGIMLSKTTTNTI